MSREAELEAKLVYYNNIELFGDLSPEEEKDRQEIQAEYDQILAQEQKEKEVEAKDKKKARKRVEKRWKRAEDWWWKYLKGAGWKRWGHIRRGVSCADFSCPIMILDVTTTKRKIPKWIKDEIRDARLHASPSQDVVVAIHEVGEDMRDGIIIQLPMEWIGLHIGNKGG